MKDSTLQTEKISFSFIEFILLMDMPSLNWIPLVKKESPVVENFVDSNGICRPCDDGWSSINISIIYLGIPKRR